MDARKVLQQGRMPLAIVGQGELSVVLWPENATFLSALTGTPDPPQSPIPPVLPTPPASPESPSLTETLLSDAEVNALLAPRDRHMADVGGSYKAVALAGFFAGFVCCVLCLLILRAGGR